MKLIRQYRIQWINRKLPNTRLRLGTSLYVSDFSETPLGADSIPDLQEEIDVVVMDFAIDDFGEYSRHWRLLTQ